MTLANEGAIVTLMRWRVFFPRSKSRLIHDSEIIGRAQDHASHTLKLDIEKRPFIDTQARMTAGEIATGTEKMTSALSAAHRTNENRTMPQTYKAEPGGRGRQILPTR